METWSMSMSWHWSRLGAWIHGNWPRNWVHYGSPRAEVSWETGAMGAPGTGVNLEAGSTGAGTMVTGLALWFTGVGLMLRSALKLDAHTTLFP